LNEAAQQEANGKRREETLLELLGEKEERLSELRLDVAESKQIYREQIVDLVEKVEALENVVASLKSNMSTNDTTDVNNK
jgi:hypothetical protein